MTSKTTTAVLTATMLTVLSLAWTFEDASASHLRPAPEPRGLLPGVQTWPEITYGHDGYSQATCTGTDALNYTVFAPTAAGPHSIVFGITGTGFKGSAGCASSSNPPQEEHTTLNYLMEQWAQAGYVAVNIEYHGYTNGLFGDVTYPGVGNWGSAADGTVQLDIIPAIQYFLAHNPGQYGADPASGIVVFGSSSGAHDAYMIGAVGIPGVKISAVVGWSGLPDVSKAGSYPESVFDTYMQTSPGSDVENFADPDHRISTSMPPQYVANGLNEFISPTNAEQYTSDLTADNVTAWLRVPNTSAHASAYAGYTFTGKSPEISTPPATIGTTVLDDSISFANQYVTGATSPPKGSTTGYWMLASNGTVYPFGSAGNFGSPLASNLLATSIAPTPDRNGYWVAAANGTVASFGDAPRLNPPPLPLGQTLVAIASTIDGQGYWLASNQGDVLTAGDAISYGNAPGNLNAPIVDMATTPDGKGYWLLGGDGGVFSFGDARYFGSTGSMTLNAPAISMAATSDGAGYWFVAADGGIFTFGDASYFGSVYQLNPAQPAGGGNSVAPLNKPAVGIVATFDGRGYWVVASDGGVFTFGDAGFVGSLAGNPPASPIVGFAASG